MTPLAEFADGSSISTFGRRQYRLFSDRVVVSGDRLGEKFESSVSLADIRPDPERLWVHSQMFRFGAVLAAVTLLLLLMTALIFGNYQHKFTIWYLGGGLLIVLGLAGCVAGFRRICVTRFLSDQSGVPLLAVIARRARQREQEAFAAAVQNQIAEFRKTQNNAAADAISSP